MSSLLDRSWASAELRGRIEVAPLEVLKERGIHAEPGIPADIIEEFIRVSHLVWVEGKLVPIEQFHLDPADEGLLFGRGLWESARTFNATPWLWTYHLERMVQSAKLLNIPCDPARLPRDVEVQQFVRHLTTQDVLIRLNLSAGAPGKTGMIWMTAGPLFQPPESLKLRSIVSPVPKGQLYLTLKTFQYATRLKLGQEGLEQGYDSALLVDAAGNLQEASHANIFLKFPEGWQTPVSDGGFLPGTIRRYLLERSPLPIQEALIPREKIAEAREIFVTNSNAGIVPVTNIDDLEFPVGQETLQLAHWIQPPGVPGVQYRFKQKAAPVR